MLRLTRLLILLALLVPLAGAPLIAQSTAVSGTNHTLTGQNSIALYNLDNIVFIDGNKYACSGSGISSAISSISSVGVVDARGCISGGTISSQITVPAGITLIFDPAESWTPGSATQNIFKFELGSRILGFRFNCGSYTTTYSGDVFQNDTTIAYGASTHTELAYNLVDSSCINDTSGTACKLF